MVSCGGCWGESLASPFPAPVPAFLHSPPLPSSRPAMAGETFPTSHRSDMDPASGSRSTSKATVMTLGRPGKCRQCPCHMVSWFLQRWAIILPTPPAFWTPDSRAALPPGNWDRQLTFSEFLGVKELKRLPHRIKIGLSVWIFNYRQIIINTYLYIDIGVVADIETRQRQRH